MIKANELRIGNLLSKSGVVVTIDARSIFDIWDNSNLYEPIPLTEEWLLKFGFVKTDMADLGIHISLKISDEISLDYIDGEIWIDEYNTHVKYVHQLQNLCFSLNNGQELQFNNTPFKQQIT